LGSQKIPIYAVSKAKKEIRDFNEKMEQEFMVISPTGLFQLLMLAKRRPGTHQINSDGSGGFCNDGSVLVAIGTPAVIYVNDTKPDVCSSLCTINYLHLGGKRKHPYNVVLVRHLRTFITHINLLLGSYLR
jgi:hypothetical protein